MTMKFWKHLAFVSCAVALSGCSTSDDLFLGDQELAQQELEENVIQFGTFLGQSRQTRAGYIGGITDTELKTASSNTTQALGDGANGFGVFAYYTGTNTYEQKNGTSNTLAPNFMYNEHISWKSTKWDYEDAAKVKYWPNEVTNNTTKGVDDQDNDADNNPATTDYTHGGNVSFFAYAPYVEVTASSGAPLSTGMNHNNGATDGIIGLTANNVTGDPWVKYKFNTSGQNVDLLWGTFYGTTTNVNYEGNTGMESNAASVISYPITDRNTQGYQKDILKTYRVNADLTKQTTTGKVGFAFKHALAKVGGSTVTPPGGGSVKNGLMIILDIDKDGAESGGEKPKTTIVTVKEISIKTEKVVYDSDKDGDFSDETAKYVLGGEFDLATGKWSIPAEYTTDASSGAMTHTITQSAGGESDAVLNTNIAEPASVTAFHTSESRLNDSSTGPEGVKTSTAQNVYSSEASPLVFIPGTKPSFTVTVDYLVRTFDASLDKNVASDGEGTWTKVEQKISKKVTFANPVELNKQYSILIHLGLTSVKFEATVSDWALNTDDPNYDSDDDGIVDLHVEDAYTPINVSSLIAPFSKTTWGSTETTAPTVSSAHYYDGEDKVDVNTSSVIYTVSNQTPSDWISGSGSSSLSVTANTSYTTRTATVVVGAPSPSTVKSEPITLTQYGRIPTGATTTKTDAGLYSVNASAHDILINNITAVSISWAESDASGTATSTTGSTALGSAPTTYKYIDQATGKDATWVSEASGNIKLTANTGAERKADMYVSVEDHLVKTDVTITQAAPAP